MHVKFLIKMRITLEKTKTNGIISVRNKNRYNTENVEVKRNV